MRKSASVVPIITFARVKTMGVYMCIKLSYTRPHETAVADNWSAVATVIARNRLPSISVSAYSSEQRAFNSKETDDSIPKNLILLFSHSYCELNFIIVVIIKEQTYEQGSGILKSN